MTREDDDAPSALGNPYVWLFGIAAWIFVLSVGWLLS